MEEIKILMFQHVLSIIFNMDETWLFYRVEPSCLFTAKKLFEKKEKEYMIVALFANANGAIKLPQLVLNKYMKPWAFSYKDIFNSNNLRIK